MRLRRKPLRRKSRRRSRNHLRVTFRNSKKRLLTKRKLRMRLRRKPLRRKSRRRNRNLKSLQDQPPLILRLKMLQLLYSNIKIT